MLWVMPHEQPITPHGAQRGEPIDDIMRLTTLSHELSNLLDGSLRSLTLARSDLRESLAEVDAVDRASRRLDTIWHALERMAALVDGAMRDGSRAIGRAGGPVGQVPLAQSIGHAIDVLSPLAAAALTRIESTLDPSIQRLPTGPLYTPILNAMQNAIQAVDRTGRPGVIRVDARTSPSPDGEAVTILVRDSGPGVAPGFRPFSGLAVPGAHGIGLALSATIIHAAGGSATLENATDGAGGAVFTIRCPVRALAPDNAGAAA
jgi:C4-dicarboxylate-specific signal transduction histidine kinase